MTAMDVQNIDAKIDDGLPGTGTVIAELTTYGPFSPGCTTSAAYATATYNVSDTNLDCSFLARFGFYN